MERVENVADFIVKFGDEGIDYDDLMEMAEQLDVSEDISYVSTEEGRKELGKLLTWARHRFQIQNPYKKLRDAGVSRKHDGRQLSVRPISREKFCKFIQKSTGVKITDDVLRKAETGESINDKTLFKIATARFVPHPGLDRAVELSEMIDILREELTIASMRAMRPKESSEAFQRTRSRRRSAPE